MILSKIPYVFALYIRRGFGARIIQAWDAASGWAAVALMGALTACVAFLVDVSVVTVSGWKTGYCSTAWWKAKATCCANTSSISGGVTTRAIRSIGNSVGNACEDWIPWSDGYFRSYAVYVLIALVFGLISGSVTLLTKSSLPTASSETYNTNSVSSHYNETESSLEGWRGHTSEARETAHTLPVQKGGKASNEGKVIYMAAGSGIPEIKTIISGFSIPNYLDFKVLAVKAVGSVFAVSTGMCLGKEGPFVHISTCVANLVGGLLPKYRDNGRKMREVLSAGCASGLCVAFGAPIGGVLFSFEVSKSYRCGIESLAGKTALT